VKSSAATTVTAQFTYGPAAARDGLLDWARKNNLPTATGRSALIDGDRDHDEIPDIIEFLVHGNPNQPDPNPVVSGTDFAEFILNNQAATESISFDVQLSADLETWEIHSGLVAPSSSQEIKVETSVSRRPPRRSRRAELPHRAPQECALVELRS
jgi:hypothetical protein